MTDPFSVAGNAVGVVSLGITVLQGLISYYTAFMDRNEDIEATLGQIERLLSSLTSVNDKIVRVKTTFGPNSVSSVKSTMLQCEAEVKALEKKLAKIRSYGSPADWWEKTKDMGQRLKYPFKQSTLAKVREMASDLNAHLGTALGASHMLVDSQRGQYYTF